MLDTEHIRLRCADRSDSILIAMTVGETKQLLGERARLLEVLKAVRDVWDEKIAENLGESALSSKGMILSLKVKACSDIQTEENV